LKLYDLEISGNCYRVRLFLALLGIRYEKVPVNTKKGESKTPAFLAIHPRGQLPALVDDDGTVVWESASILVYLARKHGPQWFPVEPLEAAEVSRWLGIAQQGEIMGLARARAVKLFGVGGDLAVFQETGRHFLRFLDGYMATRRWLALERPTIGDLACYPYIAMAPHAEIQLDPYPHLEAWFARIEALPGYIELPKASPENIAVASGPTGPGLKRQ
jgi:glutathione S-transferase